MKNSDELDDRTEEEDFFFLVALMQLVENYTFFQKVHISNKYKKKTLAPEAKNGVLSELLASPK
jgi:hypothetical protein